MFKKISVCLFVLFVSLFALVACGEEPVIEKATIQINVKNEMTVGDKVSLDCKVTNGQMSQVVWSIENDCLKIDGSFVEALKEGSCKLTATLGDVTESVTITITEKVYDIFWNLNGGVCTDQLPASRKASDSITLPTPTKEGSNFVGWYTTSNFSGEKITALDKTNLDVDAVYAKWEDSGYTVVYYLVDENGEEKTIKEKASSIQDYTLKDPEYNSSNCLFSGWYTDENYINKITKIDANTITSGNFEVYGIVVDQEATFKLTFDLNGGSLKYKSRKEVINDFMKDYNSVLSKVYTSPNELGTGSYESINFHTFFAGKLKDGTKIYDKWKWLAQYLYDISVEQLKSNNCNVSGLKSLLTGSFQDSGDNKYGVSYAFRAFLIGTTIRPDSSYTSVDFSIYDNANGFWDWLGDSESFSRDFDAYYPELPSAFKENYQFDGWYRDPEFTQKVDCIYKNMKVYAKYAEGTPVTSITIDNKVTEIEKFSNSQLAWTIKPANANVKSVTFISSDESIATVSSDGIITALQPGKVKITLLSKSQSGAKDEFEVEVFMPNYFTVSYKTNSYVNINESIELLATYKPRDNSEKTITWTSLNPSIATVDNNGKVTGVSAGYAEIEAKATGTEDKFVFGVTVLANNISNAIDFIVNSHNSNAFIRYDLGIGAGGPAYYSDIIGSISKILYNSPLDINRKYEATQDGVSSNHGGTKASTEFITVHYTGNMSKGANANANASYFAGGGGGTSIHYVTGNDGVYHVLDDSLIGFHAGDGTSATFSWTKTGVKVKDGDPTYPVWGISSNSKFTINGQETTITVPEGSTPETKKVTGDTFVSGGVTQPCINKFGLPFKIENGEYYMGTTWWCYSQIAAGRICSHGGNLNSTGIESAVDPGTDLWLTWQMTAQLVAQLMVDNNLDITRVVGHHFFSAKDCPQPLLENDLEIWWEFIELVKAEYQLITTFKDYEISMTLAQANSNIQNNGRVNQDYKPQLVVYNVNIKDKSGNSETIKLSSVVAGKYDK